MSLPNLTHWRLIPGLLVLLFSPVLHAEPTTGEILRAEPRAELNRLHDLKRLAQASEQRGDWLEAAHWHEEIFRRDRSQLEAHASYQRCLRSFHQQRRLRDPLYRDALLRLNPSVALDIYEQVLHILATNFVEREKTDLGFLFRAGLQEVRNALDSEPFQRDHLQGVPADLVSLFRTRLASWSEKRLGSKLEACEQVVQILRVGEQLGLLNRSQAQTALVLEFASGACNALDEYTLFLTPGHLVESQNALRGKFVGVGIDLSVLPDKVEIARVYPRSPAEEGGLMAGDRVLRIDRQPVENLPPEFVAERLRGEPGSILEIEVLAQGQMMSNLIRLVRRPIVAPSVEWRLLQDMSETEVLGYLRILTFQETTLQEVKEALAQLQTIGVQGVVLDLRGNPGGMFKSAVQVSELFLGTGIIAYTQSPLPEYNRPFKADIANPFARPMAVLINNETASAAEVLAGALKDQGRARLFGQTTYGKGTIQRVVPVPKTPTGIRITVARFSSPERVPYNHRGVTPHELVDPDSDAALSAAKMYLQSLVRMMIR